MRKTVCITALAATALTLGACGGGATVDNGSGAPSTVAPLAKPSKTATATSEVASTSARPTSTSQPGGGAAAPAPRDEAVQEVSSLPTAQARPAKEQKYLDELSKQGIKVEGVEDQMVSVASGVCVKEEGNTTVGAVAGQLVEQHRTDKKPEDIAGILVKSAKEAYC